ncbi:MAG: chemotaxis protein CheW [Bacteroidota bacterium]
MSSEKSKRINSFLTFKLGEETFAANVSKVLNILELTKITKVPKAPAYMKGVINLRGTVLPLVDTRIKFDMTATEYTSNTCILVLDIDVNNESVQVGALVDSVQEVLEIEEDQVQPPPSIGTRYRSDFIEGMVKVEDDFVMILDMDMIFSSDELITLRDTAEGSKKMVSKEEKTAKETEK